MIYVFIIITIILTFFLPTKTESIPVIENPREVRNVECKTPSLEEDYQADKIIQFLEEEENLELIKSKHENTQ